MSIKIHLAIYGILTGLIIAITSYAWNMKKVNELYLNTLQSSVADVQQYHKVQDGMLTAIIALSEAKK